MLKASLSLVDPFVSHVSRKILKFSGIESFLCREFEHLAATRYFWPSS
jgi:hypothetical protein